MECSIAEYDNRMKNIVCPMCTSRNVYRDYSSDNIYSSVKEVKTIGQLADKNAKQMSSQIKEHQDKNQKSEQKPWYHEYATATNKEINKMTNKQKANYIMEGKK
jgi:hypothetical protein